MFVENLMKKPLWVRLGNGRTLHIAPNSQSSELNTSEIENTPALQKLLKLNYVSCQSKAKETSTPETIKKKSQPKKKRRK